MRQNHNKNKLWATVHNLSAVTERVHDGRLTDPADITKTLVEVIQIAMNDADLCFNNCKGMYFCSKKRGHRGKHSDQGLTWSNND